MPTVSARRKFSFLFPQSKRFVLVNRDLRAVQRPLVRSRTLTRLARSSDIIVRQSVANHPRTPTEALSILAGDTDYNIRQAVAMSPRTPDLDLDYLASDVHYIVRMAVAMNPVTPQDVLDALASDGSDFVRHALACSLATPLVTLQLLVNDRDAGVRGHARKRLMEQVDTVADLLGMSDDVDAVASMLREYPSQVRSMLGWV